MTDVALPALSFAAGTILGRPILERAEAVAAGGFAATSCFVGDVVAWDMTPGLPHIGIVSKIKVEGVERYAVVHNIGSGARIEDVLFAWKIIGHYRYFEQKQNTTDKSRPGR